MPNFAAMTPSSRTARKNAANLRRTLKPMIRERRDDVRACRRHGLDDIQIDRECYRGPLNWWIDQLTRELDDEVRVCRAERGGTTARPAMDRNDAPIPF